MHSLNKLKLYIYIYVYRIQKRNFFNTLEFFCLVTLFQHIFYVLDYRDLQRFFYLVSLGFFFV